MSPTWCRSCREDTDQEQSLVALKELLPEQYSHTVCSLEAREGVSFKAAIKLRLSSEEEAQRWLEDFQRSSGYTWRKSKTYPNAGRYNKYRVDYRCRTMKKSSSCPATLFLILKRKLESGERKSRSGDPHMKEGLHLHVNLRNEHNHRVSCAEASVRRDVSRETIEKLKSLFESGYSPSSALSVLKYDLEEEEQENYASAAADRSVCPDLQFCYRLYYKLFKKSHCAAAAAGEDMFRDLEQTLDDYNKQRGDVCAKICQTPDNQWVIAICTPLMKRVHTRLRQSSEAVFVESSGNCSRHKHSIFLLLAHSSAGALPLGMFITTSESQGTIKAAVELLLTVLPPDRFFGRSDGPVFVVTGDCSTLRQTLQEVFPGASLVLCVLHVLQAMWRWLWSASNGVSEQHRAQLLGSVGALVFSSTPAALMEGYARLMEHSAASQYPKFVQHVQEVFKWREEWAICLQPWPPSAEGNQRNSCVASALKVVRERTVHQLKAYNMTQLVDFVLTKMDARYIRRLTNVARGRPHTSHETVLKAEDIDTDSIVQEDQDNYTVTSSSNAAVFHHVNTAVGCCTCPAGIMGGHCKHQSAVDVMFGHKISHVVSPDTQRLYHQIATGKPAVSAGVCSGETHSCPSTGDVSIKESLNSMSVDITKSVDNPDRQSHSASVTALSSSHRKLQNQARGCKRLRGVQSPAASRRKTTLCGKSVQSSGRALKTLREEHSYGRPARESNSKDEQGAQVLVGPNKGPASSEAGPSPVVLLILPHTPLVCT